MSKISNPLMSAVQKQKPTPPTVRSRNPNGQKSRRGKVGLTIHLDPVTHRALKKVAWEFDTTCDALIRQGINYVLQEHGEDVTA